MGAALDGFIQACDLLRSRTTWTVRFETVDGVERHFAVNVVAPYLLTRRLMPALEAAVHRPNRTPSSRCSNNQSTSSPALHARLDRGNLVPPTGTGNWPAGAASVSAQ